MAASPKPDAWRVEEALRNHLIGRSGRGESADAESVVADFLAEYGDLYLRAIALQSLPYVYNKVAGEFRGELRKFGTVRRARQNSTLHRRIDDLPENWLFAWPVQVGRRQLWLAECTVDDVAALCDQDALSSANLARTSAEHAAMRDYMREHGCAVVGDVPLDVANRIYRRVREGD